MYGKNISHTLILNVRLIGGSSHIIHQIKLIESKKAKLKKSRGISNPAVPLTREGGGVG